MRGYRVGHGPTEERYPWELRVLGGVIRQALEDMARGDREAEVWLAEAIGIDREDGLRLGRACLPRWPGREVC